MRPAILAFSLLLVAACTAEPASEEEAAAQGERKTGSYTVDGETGEINARVHTDEGTVATLRSGERVPVALPDGFSVYPGAEVLTNTRVDHGGGEGNMLTMRSDDSPAEVTAFYRDQAEKAGIDLEVQMNAGETQMLAGRGPREQVFSLNASDESGRTMVQLMVGVAPD
jgi:hypothetical protein